MHLRAFPVPIYLKYVLPAGPISMSISIPESDL